MPGPPSFYFDRRHRNLLAGLAAFFLLQLLLGTNGFSLPLWHPAIDGSPQTEVLLGQARRIRSDDWHCALPFALSQLKTHPPFALENDLVGLRPQNMLLMHYAAPVNHPLTIFRPRTWGFFIGPDTGLSWLWWGELLGMIYFFFLVFLLLSRGAFYPSLAGGVAVTYSAYYQAWSLLIAPSSISFAGMLAGLMLVLAAGSRRTVILGGAMVFYFASAFGIEIYLPNQVALAQLLAFAAAGLFLGTLDLRSGDSRHLRWTRMLSLLFAVIAAAGVGAYFYLATRDAMHVLANTSYPGNRRVGGGAAPYFRLFTDLFVPLLYGGKMVAGWKPFDNVCEAAAFYTLTPVIAVAFVADSWKQRKLDPLLAALLLYVAFEAVWMVFGLPPWLAHLTLLDHLPSNRAVVGVGVAGFLAMAVFLNLPANPTLPSMQPRFRGVLLAAWGALTMASGISWQRAGGPVGWAAIAGGTAGAVLFGYLLLKRSVLPLMGGLAAAMFISSVGFNPLVMGGSKYLEENDLSQRIIKWDHSLARPSTWVVFDNVVISNLPRVLGIKSLGGTEFVPQLDMWKILDPTGQSYEKYNRYATVSFTFREDPSKAEITSSQSDEATVNVSPDNPLFLQLGADFVLIPRENESRSAVKRYEQVDQVGKWCIYRRR